MLLPIARWKAVTLCQYFAGQLQRERQRDVRRPAGGIGPKQPRVQSSGHFPPVSQNYIRFCVYVCGENNGGSQKLGIGIDSRKLHWQNASKR